MSTPTSLFDYTLPPERIAQQSVEPRDHSRLLAMNRTSVETQHRRFFEIGEFLRPGDVLVCNETRVFKARLRGVVGKREIEVFLLRPVVAASYSRHCEEGASATDEAISIWESLVQPGRAVHVGDAIEIGPHRALVQAKREDGAVELVFDAEHETIFSYAEAHGEIPVPPYVVQAPVRDEQYQTVYAKTRGSAAAPTAGFHFTPRLIAELRHQGIEFAFVTLHVGLGTFRPIKSETIEEHAMHSEFVSIAPEAARQINRAKQEGRRVIAVGTTVMRALEATARNDRLPADGFSGDVNIFITPGWQFQIPDGLITNFHLPHSTLLVLVSAFAGRKSILVAYQEAIRERYRFYSFGDAMLIV